ncbi:MAG: Ig-like domain-containing protein, partial [Deltaproteobacteria bacterium]|nr:Ig-like domain-containing protein [Deltaproteobacteria bacterium]
MKYRYSTAAAMIAAVVFHILLASGLVWAADKEQNMTGLNYRLSPGQPVVEIVSPKPPAVAQILSDSETKKLIDRLPPLPAEGHEKTFNLPPESPPAPQPGKVVKEPFPPEQLQTQPSPTTVGPLELVRKSPEGEVPMAPNLSLTFSQPMVSLTGLDDLASLPIPVRLTPQPAGAWRWLGTKTLIFEPIDRFPMATEYSVEVPKDTPSAIGSRLASSQKWTFTTPPPRITQSHPT